MKMKVGQSRVYQNEGRRLISIAFESCTVMDVLAVDKNDTSAKYTFDLHSRRNGMAEALVFSRKQLLRQVEKQGYNAFLLEGYVVYILYGGTPGGLITDQ